MSERGRWWLEIGFATWGAAGLLSFFAVIIFGHDWPRGVQISSLLLVYSWYAAQRFREWRKRG